MSRHHLVAARTYRVPLLCRSGSPPRRSLRSGSSTVYLTDLLISCCRLLQDLHSLFNGCWTRLNIVNSGCACSSGCSSDLMCLVGSSFKYESSLVTLINVSLSGHPLAQAPVFHDGIPRGRGHQLCLTVWGTYRNGSFELFLSNSRPTRAASGRPRSPRNCAYEARGQKCDLTSVLRSACNTI